MSTAEWKEWQDRDRSYGQIERERENVVNDSGGNRHFILLDPMETVNRKDSFSTVAYNI